MKGNVFQTLALSLGMALLAPVHVTRAQGPEGGPPPDRPGGMERREEMRHHHREMMKELDLSKEQREKIADLREKHERAAIRMRADLQTARLDLRRLARAEKPDRMAIGRQVDRIGQIRSEIEKARMMMVLDIRGLLTPEQQERMKGPGGGEDF